MTREGARRDLIFTVCDGEAKTLVSVSQICRTGRRVISNPPWSDEGAFIEHVETGERLWLEEQHELYVLTAKVPPKANHTSVSEESNFPWQVSFRKQWATSVIPSSDQTAHRLCPIHAKSDELEAEGVDYAEGGVPIQKDNGNIEDKVEELATGVTQHVEDKNNQMARMLSVVKVPPDEREKTSSNASYGIWVKPCLAAQVVRRLHPTTGREAHVVPDTDDKNGGTSQVVDGIHVPP